MNRRHSILFFLLLSSVFHLANACVVYDDAGVRIALSHPAKRIISLAPDLTELLFAAGAGKQIVGVIKGSDYPTEANTIPIVASFNQLDLERIATLHPDLIVVWADSHLVEQLKKLDSPVYVSQQRKLTDIPHTLQRLGCLAGTSRVANSAAKQFFLHYHQLQKKYSTQKKLPVFYQVWPQPLMTITKASWINEVITLCGGKNIFADLIGVAPEVSVEAVIRQNPAVIIGSKSQYTWQRQWDKWPELFAVKKKAVYAIDADLIARAGPRVLEGAEEMCYCIAQSRNTEHV